MWAIIDNRASKEAIDSLSKHFDVLEFRSENITYKEVSGHPDIFIFQNKDNLIIAPNSPIKLIEFLDKNNVNYKFGKKEVGSELKNSTQYNCIVTKDFLLHKKGFTDSNILSNCTNKELFEMPQAYTRCSLTMLNDNSFITSDKGIFKSLVKNKNNDVLLVEPNDIELPGYPYGFFGGTNGVFNNKIYFTGSLNFIKQGNEIREFIESKNIEIIELYKGKLYDGGGIFMGI